MAYKPAGKFEPLLDPGHFTLADAAEAHTAVEGGVAEGGARGLTDRPVVVGPVPHRPSHRSGLRRAERPLDVLRPGRDRTQGATGSARLWSVAR